MSAETSPLSLPLELPNGSVLPNRLAKAAMTEGLADSRGYPSAELERLYARWGKSGCGLLITGNVLVDRHHLERPGNVVIDREPDADMRAALQRWATAAKAGGAKTWMQISHAGRQTAAIVNPQPLAPSAIALALPGKQFGTPVAMTEADIAATIERFAMAAEAAKAAGFDGVQIHAAHGYLLSAFLNPRANQRNDRWGGSLENRARMLLEVLKAVRARTGAGFTVAVKLNSADFQKGGFSFADSTQVAEWLTAAGIDLIEISGGNYEQPRMMDMEGVEKPDTSALQASTAAREAYFIDFAIEMQRKVSVPLMVTGGFRSAAAMTSAVSTAGVALIGLGRPLCVDTDCARKLLEGEQQTLDRWERQLQLGPGWLGPHSPFGLIRMLNGFGATYWYYQQFRHFGRGEKASLGLSVFSALLRELREQKRWLASARFPE
ncbi:NADH:flavin oxidoreductase/NADH oxidase family protein [Pseudomonas sp. N040]|uniref:NADH:flavin oxidoreductase/NADH oxidase family protein n=1 Tax=Pseudomonas sp. N040 TaxID=2785325 RepID=UPI0018A24B99|nr:NADH:flavin oxidoreductase/NADH oxidase family protein [Pseudomonas sp. N040]MBF7729929.1 NADH:flavin oxidoreductase/NADH oxidase family protein [Pseudomonas sp. N040]MBW7013571.1 NADH:flavin oxidoreductase/NADH oxidase family protein [Pseudomonas sp. N040]